MKKREQLRTYCTQLQFDLCFVEHHFEIVELFEELL